MQRESRELEAQEARKLRRAGLSYRQIAKRLGVSPDTVQRWTTVEVPEVLLEIAQASGRELRLVEADEKTTGTPFNVLRTRGPRLIRNEPDPSWSLSKEARRKIAEMLGVPDAHTLIDAFENRLGMRDPYPERTQLRGWARFDREILVFELVYGLEELESLEGIHLTDEDVAEVVAVALDARCIPRPGFECEEKEIAPALTASRSRLVRYIQKIRRRIERLDSPNEKPTNSDGRGRIEPDESGSRIAGSIYDCGT